MLKELKMTEYQPTPQTPEQVADGLRNAFRQAKKDGVMDATPYLEQMTSKSDIEKVKQEIKVLEKKLALLEEIETHKPQPRMNFLFDGKCEVVSYNKKSYYRFEFPDEVYWYRRTSHETYLDLKLERITDGETHRLLEGVWFNDVKKGKYDEPYCPDDPEYYDEIEWDEKDNPKSKTIRDIIDRWWMDTFTSKNMWSVNECIDDLADQIEFWILRNKK
jgi:polyhydroxyalkanoate synthesis regulator phasin